MNSERLKEVLKSELPINRKEKFYTGTILPELLFHGGLSNLFRFLHEIPEFPNEVNEQNTKDEFLFYTEYNLKKSAGKKNTGTEIYTATKDTPDVIVQILKPLKLFVIIEAKIFEQLSQRVFNLQMKAQKKAVIDVLKLSYPKSHMFHVALVPSQLGFKDTPNYRVINWQFFINSRELNVQSNYFFPFLKYAIENYSKLVSEQSWEALTLLDKLHGREIYQDGKTDKKLWVGRKGGSRAIEEDVKKRVWKNKLYGTNIEKPYRKAPKRHICLIF